MSKQDQDFQRWLRQQLFRERTRPLEKFVLRHAGPGSKGNEVEEFPISSTLSGDQIPMVADEIMTRAQADADSLGTKLQRYVVFAIEVDAKSGPRFPFRLRGEGEEDDESDGEEPATEKGLLAQTMRHNEALMRMAMMGMGTTVQHLQRQLESAGKTIEVLSEQRTRDQQVIEAAKSEEHERDIQLMLETGKQDRQTALFKQLEAALPAVVNRIAGRSVIPEKEMSLLRPFINSLTEDQIRSIASQLSSEQQISLFNIYNEMKKSPGAPQEQGGKNGVH